ncbi:hypothetical protein Ahy_B04g072776 isoform A [Arachis hypogaea]|uniref:Retrotransposon gag domain-containing protein n=1 Tax=Arachis hypogaea TaxID=3818 RepID=A0A444ZNX9_ARAHY|nr:hypothetical protein Ahy_B04g072776 isoform A [Arachis hypogaea]
MPKIVTKFGEEVGESTTEYITQYMVELDNLANDENLKMKFFASSLTKNAFTWFSNLRPNSIVTWAQLESTFHAQFYRGELNVTITDLVALKHSDEESIDDFMIRFKNDVLDLDYLAERVHQIELLQKEKEKFKNEKQYKGKSFARKEKVSYLEMESLNQEFDNDFPEVDLAKLKKGPPYNIKQLILPEGNTLLSIKDLKEKPYCKFHQATSHSTNNFIRFRHMIQEAIMEGRLKFDDSKKT